MANILQQLDELKTQFTPGAARRVERLLKQLSRTTFTDTDSLFRYHELLLFIRAYPQNESIALATDTEFQNFSDRVNHLSEQEVDLSPLQHPEVSGIAG